MRPKIYKSSIWLRKRYIVEKKSILDMAKEAKVSERTIRNELKKAGYL